PFGNDLLSRFQAAVDDPHFSDAVAHLNCPNVYPVVRSNYCDLITPLQLRDSPLRNKQGILIERGHRANTPKLTGPQDIAWICERANDPNCPGLRVYLAVREQDASLMRIYIAVRQSKLKRHGLL